MRSILLGGCIPASRLAYGCVSLGGSWDPQSALDRQTNAEAVGAVRSAMDAGITHFDHADIYACGKSETAFANAMTEIGSQREDLLIQTKVGVRLAHDPRPGLPSRYDFSRDHILAAAEGSLRRLGIERIDLYLLHRPDPLVEPEEVAHAFDDLHRAGKVRAFGVSNHTWAQIELLRRHLHQPLLVNQLELSLAHPQLITSGINANRLVPSLGADATLDYCRLHDITIQAWSPLAKGRAIGAATDLDNPLHALTVRIAQRYGVTPEAIAIAWLLRHPGPIQPVIGSHRPERIRSIALADKVALTREEWFELLQAASGAALP